MAMKRPDRISGGPHSTFWQWCAKGELRLQRCCKCGELNWPAVAACDNCSSEEFSWEKMSGKGKVVSWCTFEKDYYAGMFPMPWTNIVVELAEGPWFLSEPSGFDRDEIELAMPVTVAFLPCEDSTGPFALPVFERDDG